MPSVSRPCIRVEIKPLLRAVSSIYIEVNFFQPALGLLQGSEADLLIEGMGVPGGQGPAAQALQVGMRHDGLHKPDTESLPAIGLQDEHIGEVGERGRVGDHAREADLLILQVDPEVERVLNRALHSFARDTRRPVGSRQKAVDHREVKPLPVGADEVGAAPPLVMHSIFLRVASSI